jgi:hypothetical protein
MKKALQKSIMEWYNTPKYVYNELGQEELVDYTLDTPEVIMSNYLSFRARNGKQPTKSEYKEMNDCYEFLYEFKGYVSAAIYNVERMMESSPFNTEYKNKSQFEKALSVYNSYLELEKLVPGRGDETVQHFYNQISN